MAYAPRAAGGPPARRPRRPRGWATGIRLLALLILAIMFMVPFVWLFLTALKSLGDLAIFPPKYLPTTLRWDNFTSALTLIDYGKYARNSFFLASMYMVIVTATSAMTGFAFARLRGPGKGALFGVLLATTMLPQLITIIPLYMILAKVGLINTYWPWALFGLSASPFLSFLFRQFFGAIPLELEDAAIVDGCGYVRIFWQIFLPLSKPVIATAAVLSFQAVWNDFFTPFILLAQDNTTLAAALVTGYVDAQSNVLPQVLSAGTIIYILPVVVLFFVAQRFFVQGIVTSGLKG